MSNEVLIIVLLVAVMLLAMFFIPQWRGKRAVRQVLQIFREHSAIDAKSAKPPEDLGFKHRGMLEGLLRGRDYKQDALRALMRAEIVQATEDGRLYLSEDRLSASGLGRDNSYYR